MITFLFFLFDLIEMTFFYGFMTSNSDLPSHVKLTSSIGFGCFAFAALCFYIAAIL